MIKYTCSTSEDHLEQILKLQQANLPKNITKNELEKEGFVTLEHNLELLKLINSPYQHSIALVDNKVIGYALVTLPEHVYRIPLLQSTLDDVEDIIYDDITLSTSRFFIMGQVCIDKENRGNGVFKGLYDELSKRMSKDYDFIITEIAVHNHRSMRAHEKIGFQIIKVHKDEGEDWAIVLLDIRNL